MDSSSNTKHRNGSFDEEELEVEKNTKLQTELEAIIKDVKIQIRKHYAGIKEQIKRIGHVLKASKLIEENDICAEIKNALREEINEKIISSDTIERCCPHEWKRKTKPKKEPQSRFFEDKNSQEQETVTNVNTNVTSEGQILEQELDPDEESKEFKNQKSKAVQQLETETHQSEENKILRSELDKLKERKKERGEISGPGTVQGASVAELEDRESNKVQSSDSLTKISEEPNEGHILHLECFISYEEWWARFVRPVSRLSRLKKEMVHAKIDIDRRTQIGNITIE
jgi:hypothetical protein